MRAITVTEPGGPDALAVSEVPTPSPGEGELLVNVVAAGVNRADTLQRRGHYPPPKGVTDIIGLEYVAVPAGQVVRPPEGVDLVTAAGLIEVAATVVSNMRHVHLADGETFLVHGGTGGIGAFAIQYAKQHGCRVAATAGSPEKVELCRELGADIALDYHDDWVAGLKEATDGRGVDVILDVMGAKYLGDNVKSLARLGRLVVIGLQGGVKGELNLNALLGKCATVTATSLRFRPASEKAEICAAVASDVWPMVADGRIRLARETRVPFAEVQRAHELLESGDNVGKIILTL